MQLRILPEAYTSTTDLKKLDDIQMEILNFLSHYNNEGEKGQILDFLKNDYLSLLKDGYAHVQRTGNPISGKLNDDIRFIGLALSHYIEHLGCKTSD